MINLTDFQVYSISHFFVQWDARNKERGKDAVLDLPLFKKVFKIVAALRPTVEAIEASKITMADLHKNKEATSYDLDLLSSDEADKMIDSIAATEILSWITLS